MKLEESHHLRQLIPVALADIQHVKEGHAHLRPSPVHVGHRRQGPALDSHREAGSGTGHVTRNDTPKQRGHHTKR